jgi:hypothetical protein
MDMVRILHWFKKRNVSQQTRSGIKTKQALYKTGRNVSSLCLSSTMGLRLNMFTEIFFSI